MDINDFVNGMNGYKLNSNTSQFDQFEARELYCPKCKRAVPVKKRLLLILPEGEKYEYLCTFCSEPVGDKIDKRMQPSIIIPE